MQESNGQIGKTEDQKTCFICNKVIVDLTTAIPANPGQVEPAHFECVLEKIRSLENLKEKENVVYLGAGDFGVIEYVDKNRSNFIIRRRIKWEKEGEKQEWRKKLCSKSLGF